MKRRSSERCGCPPLSPPFSLMSGGSSRARLSLMSSPTSLEAAYQVPIVDDAAWPTRLARSLREEIWGLTLRVASDEVDVSNLRGRRPRRLTAEERKSLTHGDFWIPEEERQVYKR